MAVVEEQLVVLLFLFSVAAVVGVVTSRYTRLQYTTGLVLAGLSISLVGSPVTVEVTSEFILLALLPALVFNDAVNINVEAFRANIAPILALAVAGLLLSIAALAAVGQAVFGFSLAVAVLFGAIVMPTDPVSVLAIFEDLGVPERLHVLVEGESLLNDGVSIVVYSSVLAVIVEAEARGVAVGDLVTPAAFLADVGLGIVVALAGGVLAGGAVGYVAYELIARVDDEMTAAVVSFIAAYGVYLGLDLLGSSGVIGTLTAGVFLAARSSRPRVSPEAHFTVEAVWGYAAFVANTLVFVALGVITPFELVLAYLPEILAAVVLVFLARAVVVYPLVSLLNQWLVSPITRGYQHVLTWSGIHASVSIALVLGAAETLTDPLAQQLSALVFGVAAVTLLVNGPTMGAVLDRAGVEKRRPPQRLYEALVGRLHGVDAALDTAERLLERDELPTSVFEDVTATYRRERTELAAAIERLLDRHPDIREHEERLGQHRILVAEYHAIREAVQRGEISRDVGERLLEDVEVDLDRVMSERSVGEPRSVGGRPYWREQLARVDLGGDDDQTSGSPGEDPTDSGGRTAR